MKTRLLQFTDQLQMGGGINKPRLVCQQTIPTIFDRVTYLFLSYSLQRLKSLTLLDTEQNCFNSVNQPSFAVDYIYRVFHFDSTSFIPLVEQHKLHSCNIAGLSKIMQVLRYRHLNFLFKKNFCSNFRKNSNSRTMASMENFFKKNLKKF